MKTMLILTGFLLLSASRAIAADVDFKEGVYVTPSDQAGYAGSIFEFRNGKYRCWAYSDVVMEDAPKYPIFGSYKIKDQKLIMRDTAGKTFEQIIMLLNNHWVLFPAEDLKSYQANLALSPYSVLIWVQPKLPKDFDDKQSSDFKRPSIRVLYDDKAWNRVKKWYPPED